MNGWIYALLNLLGLGASGSSFNPKWHKRVAGRIGKSYRVAGRNGKTRRVAGRNGKVFRVLAKPVDHE